MSTFAKWIGGHAMRLALVGVGASLLACTTLASIDPNALWKVVHYDCEAAAKTTGRTGVCAGVDLNRRFAIFRDRGGVAQHLLIPTDRISGIESPQLLSADARHYWAYAWDSRAFVQAALRKAQRNTLADDQLGLEINSAYGRSQEQLHIHIDCMKASASETLARHRHDAFGQWKWDTVDGVRYRIMRMSGPAFDFDPFAIVAQDRTGPDGMALQTILVTGAGASASDDGWLILNSATDVEDGTGSAEELLDHRCEAARNEIGHG